VQGVVLNSLKLESQIGFGGLIHNFKNAVLRPAEADYILNARQNAENAINLIDQLEASARRNEVTITLTNTRDMVAAYASALDDVETRAENGLTTTQLDQIVRYDDTPALQEIERFQNALTDDISDSIEAIEMTLLLAGILISMIALAGGYYIFTLSQEEQRRINARRRAVDQKLIDRVNLHNADLQRVNKSLQQFAGIAAHDLSTPSRQIISLSDLASSDQANDEERGMYLQAIRDSALRMRRLVETLLEFAKQGFENPNRDVVNTSSLVRDIVNELSRNLERPFNIRIGELPYLLADRDLLERVFTNLLENSIRYARPGETPHIEIDGWKEMGRFFYSITDKGVGIDPAYSDLIFEPFKRLKNDDQKGSGMGLSLVKSIIESHGGRIKLDTKYKEGARFVFWIPDAQQHAAKEVA